MSSARLCMALCLWGAMACKTKTPAPAPVAAEATAPEQASFEGVDEPSTADRYQDVVVRLKSADSDAALRELRRELKQLVAKDDTLTDARFNLGVVHYKLEEWYDASDVFIALTRDTPDDALAWQYLALTELALGDEATAVRRLRRGIEVNDDNMELHVALVSLLRKNGELDAAIEAGKQALRVNSDSLAVFNEMGLAYLELGDFGLARFVFEKASTIPGAESDAEIQANLGWTLYQQGYTDEARRKIENAVAFDPSYVPARVYLARLHLIDHNYTEVVPLLEEAAIADPTNAALLLDLGVGYRGTGEFEKARAAYEKAQELSPSSPEPLFNLGVLLGDYIKDYDAAIRAFEDYLVAGGAEVALAQDYIAAVTKEQERAEKRRKREEAKRKREADRKAREAALRESAPDETSEGAGE